MGKGVEGCVSQEVHVGKRRVQAGNVHWVTLSLQELGKVASPYQD